MALWTWMFVVLCLHGNNCLDDSTRSLKSEYLRKRQEFIDKEDIMRTGGALKLSCDEAVVNSILMSEKQKAIEQTITNGAIYPPAINFQLSKDEYERSPVFKIIRKMPKGGILHLHSMAIPSAEWIVKNLTYHPDCYMCIKDNVTTFRFFKPNSPRPSDCTWHSVSEMRKIFPGGEAEFDESIRGEMSLSPEKTVGKSNKEVWKYFIKSFLTTQGLLTYAGTLKTQIRQSLKEAWDDHIIYFELRGLFEAYDDNGAVKNREWVLNQYLEVIKEFQVEFPDFIGVKFAVSGARHQTKKEIGNLVKEAIELRAKYPDDVIGFDIDFDEDRGPPMIHFLDELLYPSEQSPPLDLPYFFHAGETDWIGTSVDYDMLDAILLNTRRIGHGFAIHGHPAFLPLIKERGIAVEVNPISNQVLGLINDLRVHPVVFLLAQDYPVVVSSDDPNFYGNLPSSHDFYAAFMALGGARADLRFLKQLAINSIKYSAMRDGEKERTLKVWHRHWDSFIQDILNKPT